MHSRVLLDWWTFLHPEFYDEILCEIILYLLLHGIPIFLNQSLRLNQLVCQIVSIVVI